MARSQLTLVLPDYAPLIHSGMNQSDIPLALSKLISKSTFTANIEGLNKRLYTLMVPDSHDQTDMPMAQLRASSAKLCADPCHVYADQGRLLLFHQNISLTIEQADSLITCLSPVFAEYGLTIKQHQPEQWLVYSDKTHFPAFTAIDELEGQPVLNALPQGHDAKEWLNLWNAVQMTLFDHPLNQQREAEGLLPINSIWFWGRGELPSITTEWSSIWGQNAFLRQLAQNDLLPLEHFACCNVEGASLCCLSPLRWEGDWQAQLTNMNQLIFAPVWKGLRRGQLKQVKLIIPSLGDYQLSTLASWKWWS